MKITCLILEDSKLFGLYGTVDLFHDANLMRDQFAPESSPYKLKVLTVGKVEAMIPKDSGFLATTDLDEASGSEMIIIPAFNKGDFDIYFERYKHIASWLKEEYKLGATLCSLCSGAFLLASTGLLNGKNATTHWVLESYFRKLFPEVNLVSKYILTVGDRLITSGGATNSFYALLYIVRSHMGEVMARQLACLYGFELDRVSQSQFSVFTPDYQHGDEEVKKAQQFIEENYTKDLSIDAIIEKTDLGKRQLFRRFKDRISQTPYGYLQLLRVEAAKNMLSTSRKEVKEIMQRTGYKDMSAFRNVFHRYTGMSPREYRKKTQIVYWDHTNIQAQEI